MVWLYLLCILQDRALPASMQNARFSLIRCSDLNLKIAVKEAN